MLSRGGTTLVGAPFTDFSVATAAQVTTAMAYTRDLATLPSKEESRVLRGTHIQALTSVLEQVVRHGGILFTPPPYYEEPAPMQDFILTEADVEESTLAEIRLMNQQANPTSWSTLPTSEKRFSTAEEEIRHLRNEHIALQQDKANLESAHTVRNTVIEQLKTTHATSLSVVTQQANESADQVVRLEARVAALDKEVQSLQESPQLLVNACPTVRQHIRNCMKRISSC